MAGIAQELQGQGILGGAPLLPHAAGEGQAALASRPDAEDHRPPKRTLRSLFDQTQAASSRR